VSLTSIFAAAIPFDAGARYAAGQNVYVPLYSAIWALFSLAVMVWYIRKVKKEKKKWRKKK
jgi:hypothetical protein